MAKSPIYGYLDALRLAEERLHNNRIRFEQDLKARGVPEAAKEQEAAEAIEGWFVPPRQTEIAADQATPHSYELEEDDERRRFTPATKTYEFPSPSSQQPEKVAEPPANGRGELTEAEAKPSMALEAMLYQDAGIEVGANGDKQHGVEFALNAYEPKPEPEFSPDRMEYLEKISERTERIWETERNPAVEIRYLHAEINNHLGEEFRHTFPEDRPVDPKAVENFIAFCDATLDAVCNPALYRTPEEPQPREQAFDDAPHWTTMEQERTEARQSTLMRERGDRVAEMWDRQTSDASRQMKRGEPEIGEPDISMEP